MAASGTTKNITTNQILGAGGTATLASATITGDLTVRTNQLVVNSTGVGVGTTPSAWSGIGPAIQVEQASLLSEASNQLYLTANGYFAGGQWNYINNASADQYYQIAGSHVWRSGTGGAGGTAIGWSTLMTLNSTGLGVGGSPAGKITAVSNASLFEAKQLTSGAASYYVMDTTVDASGKRWRFGFTGMSGSTVADFSIYNQTDNLPIADFKANGNVVFNTGNVGVGVTPSAWNATYNALDIGQNGSISGRTSTNNTIDIVSNGFRNSGGTWVYKLATSSAAARYQVDGGSGAHLWYIGVAGTAGNTIAGFSTASMTLDPAGNLIWSPSATPPTLVTNGNLTVNATSNTNLRFSYRGSDGTTRVANITLA
jgi:hypothetical protein